jgi:hypothetical protein
VQTAAHVILLLAAVAKVNGSRWMEMVAAHVILFSSLPTSRRWSRCNYTKDKPAKIAGSTAKNYEMRLSFFFTLLIWWKDYDCLLHKTKKNLKLKY